MCVLSVSMVIFLCSVVFPKIRAVSRIRTCNSVVTKNSLTLKRPTNFSSQSNGTKSRKRIHMLSQCYFCYLGFVTSYENKLSKSCSSVNHFGQFGFGIPLAITSCTLQLPLPITIGTFLYQSLGRILGAEWRWVKSFVRRQSYGEIREIIFFSEWKLLASSSSILVISSWTGSSLISWF